MYKVEGGVETPDKQRRRVMNAKLFKEIRTALDNGRMQSVMMKLGSYNGQSAVKFSGIKSDSMKSRIKGICANYPLNLILNENSKMIFAK